MTSLDGAAAAVERLHDRDGGRVAIVVPSAAPHAPDRPLPGLGQLDGLGDTEGARPAAELVLGSTAVAAWARHRLARTVVVDDLLRAAPCSSGWPGPPVPTPPASSWSPCSGTC
jgi:hypothetical protein